MLPELATGLLPGNTAPSGLYGWIVNTSVVAATVALAIFFARPFVRRSTTWRATVTPLASIVGSGFLVVAPLLGFTVGRWAVFAMAGIVGLAYLVGSAVRYNIRHVEDIIEKEASRGLSSRALNWMSLAAKLALAAAYVIAITFYLKLLGAFILRLGGIENTFAQNLIATTLVVFIGGFGWWRGLRILESFEKYAVEGKLAIIGGLLVGLAFFNGRSLATGNWQLPELDIDWNLRTVRQLLGAFLIVQGFETSRYLRGVYRPEKRVATMRIAQWIAAAIYLIFIGLATVLFGTFHEVSETGIIDLSQRIAFALPFLLVLGAAMSQFSAAVADTVGAGGLIEEATRERIKPFVAYPGIALIVIALLWVANVFEIIAFASRAFAFYYAIQCGMAALHCVSHRKGSRAAYFLLLAFVMLVTCIFGIPAESANQ